MAQCSANRKGGSILSSHGEAKGSSDNVTEAQTNQEIVSIEAQSESSSRWCSQKTGKERKYFLNIEWNNSNYTTSIEDIQDAEDNEERNVKDASWLHS